MIFDCDGTLVDSEGLSVQLLLTLFAERGIDLPYDALWQRFHGRRFASFLDEVKARFPALDTDELTAEYRARTPAVFEAGLQPMPGAHALLADLKLERSVASNGPRAKIQTSLGLTGLLPYFTDRIVSAYDVQAWKPDPALIHAAAALMRVPTGRCLLVEDSVPGVEAGLAAGAHVAALGIEPAQLGMMLGRVTRIGSLAELRPLLGM